MSSGEKTISKAQQWCIRAREILNQGNFIKRHGDITKRAAAIAKELKELQTAITGGKSPLAQDVIDGFVAQFSSISEALKTAAENKDGDQVQQQSNRLEELKRELDVKLATPGKKTGKAQTSLEKQQAANLPKDQLAAKKLLDALKGHTNAGDVAAEIGAIQLQLTEVQNKVDAKEYGAARTLVDGVAPLCATATARADSYKTYRESQRDPAQRKIATFTHQEKAAVQGDLDQIEQNKIVAADQLAKADDFSGAQALVGEVDAELVKVTLKADKLKYDKDRPPVEALSEELEWHDETDRITKDLERVRKLLMLSQQKADGNDYPAALKLLKQASDECNQAKAIADKYPQIKADVEKQLQSATPDVDSLKLLAKEPGGTRVIDELVKGLGKDPPTKVIKAALEARFNIKVKDTITGDDPNEGLKRVYELMGMVPESHTRDNKKFKKINKKGDNYGTNAYGKGELALACGRPGNVGSMYEIGSDTELPGVGKEWIEDGPTPPYFDWLTLHEVGHAVEDGKKIMKKNMSNANYGVWKEFSGGSKEADVVKDINKVFKYDAAYMIAKMKGSLPAVPDCPDNVEQDQWDERQQKFDDWCDVVLNTADIWDNGAKTQQAVVGTKVYHKAYGWLWVSYDFAARAQGVSGYQFRASGEWFSELYAAYWCGKLKSSHPMYSMLQGLGQPKKI
jgi:hypothetical protein